MVDKDAAAAAVAVAMASNSERHVFESFARHLQDAAMLIQRETDQQVGTPVDASDVESASVLLLSWTDDDSQEPEVESLHRLLTTRYHYHTQRWLIPNIPNPIFKLCQKLDSFLSQGSRDQLLIICYVGLSYTGSNNQVFWTG